jgi:hypothetical protein
MPAEWSLKGGYRRVQTPVTLAQARERLIAYREALSENERYRLWSPAWLARVIWPDAKFGTKQGAGRCAASILHKIGCQWTSRTSGGTVRESGWDLDSISGGASSASERPIQAQGDAQVQANGLGYHPKAQKNQTKGPMTDGVLLN